MRWNYFTVGGFLVVGVVALAGYPGWASGLSCALAVAHAVMSYPDKY